MTYEARILSKVECEIGYNRKNARSSFAHVVEHDGSYCGCSPFRAGSGRSQSETWAGCIVSLTTLTSSLFSASRSVSSLSVDEKASRVFLASYFLR